ncbi:MAG: bifunctional UDP-3-O-[3-hydroxymyristoyl] N-acetylglucosamine deacetylase/3-hydroxyacyl-ACP dehydratase [Puniceicoccales bacterium]|jgi:UDP-3-O-[3-hydroxymyristoyl] N-acetylglucosamine deacetylase/3-hydroxyacyl-[acyl-carrier-protein] dehydratase|nr:bifunctional UDP-3-O-[3-hydroxymyristoyl] N-acetylglucosamine deacetylase/3-hydroxyacyl-ACP dehydratase [Puniceicoccales bacterium]
MKQRTLLGEASIKGKSLHTGQEVTLTVKPAPEDTGIVFRRADLVGKPEVRPTVDMVTDLVRNTTVASEHVKLHTIEHVLSAFNGMGVDNAIVEMNASEPPIVDGSARPFVNLILQATPVEQEKARPFFALQKPVTITDGNRSVIALPHDGLRITCTSADDRGIHTQHLTVDIDPEVYVAQIAAARTFTIYEDIEELLKKGLIQGGSLDSAIVIKGDKIVSKEPLRFKDEFVRHKILDIIGDISLVGIPIKAHIIAVRTGHALNAKLSAAIREQWKETADPAAAKKKKVPAGEIIRPVVGPLTNAIDIRQILNLIPHRYPFVLIDRVTEIVSENELYAIKNVTINEPFFQGHFPGNPVMPGVLQLESMSQAAGLLMLRLTTHENKVCYFMSADKVKFRKAVTPGDQVVIHAKLVKTRGVKIGVAECECKVGGELVSSAEIMFGVIDDNGTGA